ncbi:MAG: hypothetical protein HRU14_10740 [Planctomycetes bacterium]|nr:hypothetical protein [Planctomycetota bacterium]
MIGGTIEAKGFFSLAIPLSGISYLSGQTWWGVALQPEPCLPGLYEVITIQAVGFP